MTVDEQLALWVQGRSAHNDDRGECCPDFSCCNPESAASREERETYVRATGEIQMGMLGTFLGRAMANYKPKTKVHVAGDHGDEH